MSKGAFLAATVLLCAALPARAGQPAIGSMPIPAGVADLAAAAGIHRVDASTLPLDIVRVAFASPDGTSVEEAAARAGITGVLARAGSGGDALPLPLTAKTWTSRILGLQVAASDATIYVIGQGRALIAPALQKLLRQLAAGSGGRAFFTDEDTKLESIFQEIVEDLRHQYLLGYSAPDNARNGEWHKIRVEIPGRGYQVRARLGYRLARRNPQ